MTDAQQEAVTQVAKLAAAIRRRGGAAGAAAISTKAGLPLRVVTRRLNQNGTANTRPECRYFWRTSEGWKLTDRGRARTADPAA